VADQLVNVSAIGESRNSKFGRLTPQRPLADWPQGGERSDRKSVSKRENWLRELLISSKMCLMRRTGRTHAAAMKSDAPQPGAQTIMNPKNLDPVASVDFCGACHRTWEDVVTAGFTRIGTANARFAPYRLENSKCWRNPDARLTCVACHDPHQPLEHDPAAYDSRCLQCHVNQRGAKTTADHPGAACRIGTKDCTTCHMPKIESASQHSTFTDHWIRIVRAGKPYPN